MAKTNHKVDWPLHVANDKRVLEGLGLTFFFVSSLVMLNDVAMQSHTPSPQTSSFPFSHRRKLEHNLRCT